MANAARDNNNIPTIVTVLNTDGVTVTRIKGDATTHAIMASDGTTGSNYGGSYAKRDQNSVTTWTAVSEVDGVTPVTLYADVSGYLLIDNN